MRNAKLVATPELFEKWLRAISVDKIDAASFETRFGYRPSRARAAAAKIKLDLPFLDKAPSSLNAQRNHGKLRARNDEGRKR